MKRYREFAVLCLSIITLSGCGGRLTNWALDNFNQGGTITGCFEHPYEYVRTVTVYDQVNTVAMFDALWLSDRVRQSYIDLRSYRFNWSDEQSIAALNQQRQEENSFITFYVLSSNDIRLASSDPVWSVSLDVDGMTYTPVEIRIADLEPEYKAFFGGLYVRSKRAYKIRFNATNDNGALVISNATQMVSLWFRSVNKEEALTWCMQDVYDGWIDKKVYAPLIW